MLVELRKFMRVLLLITCPAVHGQKYRRPTLFAENATLTSYADVMEDEIVLFPAGAPNEIPGFPGPEDRRGDDGTGCGPNHTQKCDRIYNVSSPMLSVRIVKKGTGAAVIIAPGGGYGCLAWSREGLDVAHMFNNFGVSTFILKYRVPARPPVKGLPKWWAPLQDAQRAIGVVRGTAEKYDLDAKKIGFIGFSAGGHLSAHIATSWRHRIYPRIDANDDLPCRPDFSMLIYPWMLLNDNNQSSTTIAPELADIEKDHPVAFFVQNADDKTAFPQNSLQYSLQLLSVGAPLPTVHLYPTGGHGFGLCQTIKKFQECCEWPQAAQRWMQDNGFAPGFPSLSESSSHPDASLLV